MTVSAVFHLEACPRVETRPLPGRGIPAMTLRISEGAQEAVFYIDGSALVRMAEALDTSAMLMRETAMAAALPVPR